MPNKNNSVIDEQTKSEIFALNSHTLSEAQPFLTNFRDSNTYQSLITSDLTELDDEDIICLTITRRAEDTNKINIRLLKEAITNISLKNVDDIEYYNYLIKLYEDDFDLFCRIVGDSSGDNFKKDSLILKPVILILQAMNYSRNAFITKDKSFILLRGAANKSTEGYINFSGLDLNHANFEAANLNNMDLTATNLSYANLESASVKNSLLSKADLSYAKLSNAYILETKFQSTIFDCIKIEPCFINFLTEKFDLASLSEQLDYLLQQKLDPVKNELIFRSITENIKLTLINMNDISFTIKFQLLDFAINHPLFGNNKANTATNWFNSGARIFLFGKNKNIPCIPITNAQKDLISFRSILEYQSNTKPEKYHDSFMNFFSSTTQGGFAYADHQEKLQTPFTSIESFIHRYGSCYEIFGVDHNAKFNDIEKQYKKLCLKYHPDKNKAPDAVENFQKINNAKEILLNDSSRIIHDKLIAANNNLKTQFGFT